MERAPTHRLRATYSRLTSTSGWRPTPTSVVEAFLCHGDTSMPPPLRLRLRSTSTVMAAVYGKRFTFGSRRPRAAVGMRDVCGVQIVRQPGAGTHVQGRFRLRLGHVAARAGDALPVNVSAGEHVLRSLVVGDVYGLRWFGAASLPGFCVIAELAAKSTAYVYVYVCPDECYAVSRPWLSLRLTLRRCLRLSLRLSLRLRPYELNATATSTACPVPRPTSALRATGLRGTSDIARVRASRQSVAARDVLHYAAACTSATTSTSSSASASASAARRLRLRLRACVGVCCQRLRQRQPVLKCCAFAYAFELRRRPRAAADIYVDVYGSASAFRSALHFRLRLSLRGDTIRAGGRLHGPSTGERLRMATTAACYVPTTTSTSDVYGRPALRLGVCDNRLRLGGYRATCGGLRRRRRPRYRLTLPAYACCHESYVLRHAATSTDYVDVWRATDYAYGNVDRLPSDV